MVGPEGATLTPDAYANLLCSRQAGMEELGSVEDELFVLARSSLHAGLAGYSHEQPRLAADPQIGYMFELADLESLTNSACLMLLGALGSLIIAGRRLTEHGGAPKAPA